MSTRSLKWSFLFLGIWILAVHCSGVNSQCKRPNDFYYISETDPAGTQILSIPVTDGYAWRYAFYNAKYRPVKNYLKFYKHNNIYYMTLSKPLDLEELRDKYKFEETAFTIWMYCNEPLRGEIRYDIVLWSMPVNEYAPQFNTSSINVYVRETSESINVINLIDWVSDNDLNTLTREIQLFFFAPPFSPLLAMRIYSGGVYTRSALDYESLPENMKYLKAGVRVRDQGGNLGTASLTIHVLDVDDLPPKFTYPGCPEPCDYIIYTAEIHAHGEGKLIIEPAPIHAEDGDTLGSAITYTMTQGPENIFDYVFMDPATAEVTILKPLYDLKISQIVILIEAQENTKEKRRSKCTSLLISVFGGSPSFFLQARESRKERVFSLGAVLAGIIFIIMVILFVALVYSLKERHSPAVNDDAM